MNLDAYKLMSTINNIVKKGKEAYPDEVYLSEFDIEDFLNSSQFDEKYLPDDRRKLKNKLKVFNLIKKFNDKYPEKISEVFDRLAKYRVEQINTFENNLVNEVNASVISDICSNIVDYGISFRESLDFSLLNCKNDLQYINMKLKFYDKSIAICKSADLNINFKGN